MLTTQCDTAQILLICIFEQEERHVHLRFRPPSQHFGSSYHIVMHVASLRASSILQQQSVRVVLSHWGRIIICRAFESTRNLLCGVLVDNDGLLDARRINYSVNRTIMLIEKKKKIGAKQVMNPGSLETGRWRNRSLLSWAVVENQKNIQWRRCGGGCAPPSTPIQPDGTQCTTLTAWPAADRRSLDTSKVTSAAPVKAPSMPATAGPSWATNAMTLLNRFNLKGSVRHFGKCPCSLFGKEFDEKINMALVSVT